jgi:hypothetical protein
VDQELPPTGSGSDSKRVSAVATRACGACGAQCDSPDPADPALCDACALEGPALTGRLEPGEGDGGPVFVIGERRIPWALVGEVLAGGSGVGLVLRVAAGELDPPPGASCRADPADPADPADAADPADPAGPPDSAVAPGTADYPPMRPPVDDLEAESWAEAVALLNDCLEPEARWDCPLADLGAACAAARAAAAAGGDGIWALVAEAAGWERQPPADDVDLWTGAAMALISVAADSMDPHPAECLDRMELDDWLSTILELVRAGPGTPADPTNLLALSASCLDVDTGAVDPEAAPQMLVAFGVLQPVWRALEAIDGSGVLTDLGAWGLPLAVARAWGGWLD